MCWGRSLREIWGVYTRSKELLSEAKILDAVCCSRFVYDRDIDIMRAFCEAWCSDFNVVETSRGVLSISLRDLHIIGGLSVHGELYEEIVPPANDITEGILPKCCEYLFAAFLRLHEVKDGKPLVRISTWISFWFRGGARYRKPTKRIMKKSAGSQDARPPLGQMTEVSSWSITERGAFKELGIEDEDHLPSYLSAFLACWLCIFVFPQGDDFIHP